MKIPNVNQISEYNLHRVICSGSEIGYSQHDTTVKGKGRGYGEGGDFYFTCSHAVREGFPAGVIDAFSSALLIPGITKISIVRSCQLFPKATCVSSSISPYFS